MARGIKRREYAYKKGGAGDILLLPHFVRRFFDTRRGSRNSRYVKRTLLIGKQRQPQRRDYLSLITRWHRQELPCPDTGLLRHPRLVKPFEQPLVLDFTHNLEKV